MNFLAHLALAAPDDDLMAGGFFGDFIKGPIPDDLNTGIAQGVLLHRSIDAYSDRHAELGQLRQVLPKGWGRFTGIILDLFIDHYLSSNWQMYNSSSLENFVGSSQRALQAHRYIASDSALRVMDRLYKYDWLTRYADVEFTLEALRRIGSRIRFDNPLHRCDELIPDYYEQLCASANVVYADSRIHVAEWRSQNFTS
jgi:acyl carrier protein phosphodiesterase